MQLANPRPWSERRHGLVGHPLDSRSRWPVTAHRPRSTPDLVSLGGAQECCPLKATRGNIPANPSRRWKAEPVSPSAIDLFCGAGGASLGLLQAGWDLRLSADVDPKCGLTHRASLPGEFLSADLRTVDADKLANAAGVALGELDLLFAGPPCQGFSIIGSRVVWDKRNNLYREVLRLAADLRPKCVVIENVPGLVNLAKGAYLHAILEGLTALGYEAACAELLAAQYGAPQMRWRLLIIAWRKDHTRRYRRMTWDGVPRAVITRFRDPKSGEYTHPEQNRTITIREAARLQGLPDSFVIHGDKTSQYDQVGNAVPTQLAVAIGSEIRRCLDGHPGARLADPFRRRPVMFLGRHGELAQGLLGLSEVMASRRDELESRAAS